MILRWLADSSAWELVYHDEVTVVLVRREGNEAAIERARAMFPAWMAETERRLAEPAGRVWPAGRVSALLAYGALLFNIGEREAGVARYQRLLELGPRPGLASLVHYRIARHRARKGERTSAIANLEAALAADAGNKKASEMMLRLEEHAG